MSSGSTQPFRPAGTVTMAAGTGSVVATMAGRGEAVLVMNTSAATAFIRFGTDSTVVASAADTPLMAGSRTLLHCGTFASTVAVLLTSGSGTVFVTRGDGTVY